MFACWYVDISSCFPTAVGLAVRNNRHEYLRFLFSAHYIKNCAMIKENFIKLYENSFKENWDLPCYTDYGEDKMCIRDRNKFDIAWPSLEKSALPYHKNNHGSPVLKLSLIHI